MKVCLLANSGAYGNAAALAEGLKHFAEVTTIFHSKDEKGFDKVTDAKYRVLVPRADHYIVVAAISIPRLPVKLWKGNVTLILTDSTYMNNPDKYNRIIKQYRWNVWAMPDLCKLGGWKNVYYQPFIMPEVDKRKTEVVCHSPYSPEKMKQKGTAFISAVCAKHNLSLKIITGKTWAETVRIKAQYRFFIDQIFRGIGKSGLEAMLLDCAVITGVKPDTDNLPPVVWTDKKRFERDLLELIFDRERTDQIVKEQREWAEVNLDPKVIAKKIIKTL